MSAREERRLGRRVSSVANRRLLWIGALLTLAACAHYIYASHRYPRHAAASPAFVPLTESQWPAHGATTHYEASVHPQPDQPLLSIVLPIDVSRTARMASTVRALLATTAGPYELVVVLNRPSAEVGRIVDEIVMTHAGEREAAGYRTNYTAASQLGLHRYTRAVGSDLSFIQAANLGLAETSGRYVVLHDIDARPLDFAWDRYARRAFHEHDDVLAISARCAFDVRADRSGIVVQNTAGHCSTAQTQTSLENHIWLRDAVDQGPTMLDVAKLRALGPLREDLGDSSMIERFGWRCAHQAIAMNLPVQPNEPVVALPRFALVQVYAKILLQVKPPPDDGYRPLSPPTLHTAPITLVTAASQNHVRTLRQFYESVRKHMPDIRFIVYDLGFSDANAAEMRDSQRWPGIEYRRFELERFPDWFDVTKKRGEYGWKVAIITDLLREVGGLVLWLDAGDMLWRRPTEVLRAAAAEGVYSTWTIGGTRSWVHKGTADYLGMSHELKEKSEMCNGALMGFNAQDAHSVRTIADPYRECGFTRDCIGPEGSSYLNHRQDQSVLSVLMAMHGRKCPEGEGAEWVFMDHRTDGSPANGIAITVHHDADGEGSPIDSVDR